MPRWPSTDSPPAQDRSALLAIGLLALAARCLVVLLTRHSFLLINDAADYNRLAASIAAGHGFGASHVAPGGGPTALRPPAYPILLGGVYSALGDHVLLARLVGAVLGAIAAVLVTVLIRQLSGDRRRRVIGGLLAAVFPPMVIASTSVMSEALFVPLSVAVIGTALEYRQGGRQRWLAASGLLLGCAILTRPVGAVLIIPVALIALSGERHPRWRRAALLAALLAITPCAAWEARDIAVLHRVVPLTTQDGYFLAGTYNATSERYRADPGVWIVPTQDPALARLVAAHPHAREVRLNQLLEDAAVDYATAHPTYIPKVVGYNFLRLFDLTSLSFVREGVRGEYGYQSLAGTVEYVSALLMLAVAGVVLVRGGLRGWPAGVWLAPLLLLVVTLPTRGNVRFRAPLDPYLIALASGAFARRARAWLGTLRAASKLVGDARISR